MEPAGGVPVAAEAVAAVAPAALPVADEPPAPFGVPLSVVAPPFTPAVFPASFAGPNHVLTPPCLEHAPFSVLAVENVPSVHWAVAFAGAFAGFWANTGIPIASIPATTIP